MCTLRIGFRTQEEPLPLPIPCIATDAAVTWTEQLAVEKTWPKGATRLGLWPDEPPLVVRMEDVFYVGVELCSNYRALKLDSQSRKEATHGDTDSHPVTSALSGS